MKVWILETRPQFLILSVVLVILGTAMAWYDGFFNPLFFGLCFVGLLLVHITVNVLNDYFDYRSGIDLATTRTPFSGGSGILPARLMTPQAALRFGLIALLLATPIGAYFVLVRGWQLLPLFVIGAIFAVFYTPLLSRWYIGEIIAGLGMGALPVLGLYVIQSGAFSVAAIVACVPSGFLVHNLLLLNEFPDADADRKAGRRHIPIVLGKARAAVVYTMVTLAVYIWIVGGVVAGFLPAFTLLGLLTLPWAYKAIRGAFHHNDMAQLVPALAANVMVVLITQALMAVGYIIATLLA